MALILPSSLLNLPEAKLNTPDQPLNLPLNLPEIQQSKGFFETLRNPLDLMRYESLPVALFQGLSGNTKEVQAKKAQTFIEQNPNLRGSPEYLEAEAVLERYGFVSKAVDVASFMETASPPISVRVTLPGISGGSYSVR